MVCTISEVQHRVLKSLGLICWNVWPNPGTICLKIGPKRDDIEPKKWKSVQVGHRYFLALNNDKEVIDVHNNHNQNMSKTISDSVMNVSCKLNGMKHKFNYAPSSTLSNVPILYADAVRGSSKNSVHAYSSNNLPQKMKTCHFKSNTATNKIVCFKDEIQTNMNEEKQRQTH